MINFVLTILSIALTAAVLYASVTYLAPGRPVITLTYNLATQGFPALGTAFSDFKSANGGVAPAVSTWETQLTPTYTFLPAAPKGMSWSYGTDGTGYWFCLSGSVSQPQYDGLAQAAQVFSVQQYFIGSTCGITANAAAPATWPATLAATYWVTAP